MNSSENLELMETLSNDIRTVPAQVELPQWHEELIAQRQRDLDAGRDVALDWEDAKAQIQQAIRRN